MKALATDPVERYSTAEEFGAAVAEAASEGWGPDWVKRAGLSVMASGGIAAGSTTAPPTGPPRVGTTRSGTTHRASAASPTPQDLVAVQDVLPDRLPDARPTAPDSLPPGVDGTPGAPPAAPTEPGAPVAEKPPAGSRRGLVALGAAVLIVVAVLVAVVATQLGGGGSSRTSGSSAASPPGQLVFSDNFSNPNSGWAPDLDQGDNGSAAYVNGGYEVVALKSMPANNTFSVGSPYTNKLTSMASTVTAVLNGGATDGPGVRCDQGSRQGLRYTFETHGDGTWEIFKLGAPESPVLAEGSNPAIHTGASPNTITGQCTEVGGGSTRLSMTVNGVVVGSNVDSHGGDPIAWRAALTVYRSQQSSGARVRFTDFRTSNAGA
jgi:hypothetical protein